MEEPTIERLCSCGGVMFLDSYEHPKKPIEWLYRCEVCGKSEESTQEVAEVVYGKLK